MSSWLGLTSKQKRQRQLDKLAQSATNQADADIIDIICFDMNAVVARELLKSADKFIGMLDIEENVVKFDKITKHEIKCFYALHAILFSVAGQDCADILNQMSDNQIAALNQCINIVKKHPCPNPDLVKSLLKSRQAKEGLSTHERFINDYMIQTLQIALQISAVWQSAVAELQRWSDAIDAFERIPVLAQKETEVAQPEQKDLWTYAELAQKLGFPSVKYLRDKKHGFVQRCKDSTKVNELKSWFVDTNSGKPALFKAEHFEELRELLAKKPNRDFGHYDPNMLWTYAELAQKLGFPGVQFLQNKKHHFIQRCKDTSVVNKLKSWFVCQNGGKPGLFKAEYFEELKALFCAKVVNNKIKPSVEPNKPATQAPTKAIQAKSGNTLVDLIAFDNYLLGLKTLYQNACKDLESAEAEYDDTMAKISKAKISKRGALLQQAIKLNELIAKHQKAVSEAKQRFEAAESLWQSRQRALETLHATDVQMSKLLSK